MNNEMAEHLAYVNGQVIALSSIVKVLAAVLVDKDPEVLSVVTDAIEVNIDSIAETPVLNVDLAKGCKETFSEFLEVLREEPQ